MAPLVRVLKFKPHLPADQGAIIRLKKKQKPEIVA